MSRSTSKNPRGKAAAQRSAAQRNQDRGVFAVVVMVSLFILGLWFLASAETFPYAVIGCIAAILGFFNFYTLKVIRGQKLAIWQKPFARLPLRFAGFGGRGMKPLEAARGEQAAMMAFYITLAVSVALLVLATLLMLQFAD
ncbi:MAG: hypothetical protein EA377_04365 [Phycisphaerales bacterium]|nr:MAG: hypothetical protein EA377_04365 [Phycisphaerales bacterium]